MIRVNVEQYCHQCLDFTPDVTAPTRGHTNDGKLEYQTDTIIECKYRKRCAGIKRYLEQQAKSAVKTEVSG